MYSHVSVKRRKGKKRKYMRKNRIHRIEICMWSIWEQVTDTDVQKDI